MFFPFDDIAVQEGHFISLIVVYRAGLEAGSYVRLFNHHTRTLNNLLTNQDWRALVMRCVPAADGASGANQLELPASKSVFGLFCRARAAFQRMKSEMAYG